MAILLMGIVLSVAVPMLSMVLEGYLLAKASAAAGSEATLAMQRIVTELRGADSLQVSDHQLSFRNRIGLTTIAQTPGSDARIWLTQQGNSQPLLYLAQSSSLRFTRLSARLLAISFIVVVPVQGTPLEYAFRTAVQLEP